MCSTDHLAPHYVAIKLEPKIILSVSYFRFQKINEAEGTYFYHIYCNISILNLTDSNDSVTTTSKVRLLVGKDSRKLKATELGHKPL